MSNLDFDHTGGEPNFMCGKDFESNNGDFLALLFFFIAFAGGVLSIILLAFCVIFNW